MAVKLASKTPHSWRAPLRIWLGLRKARLRRAGTLLMLTANPAGTRLPHRSVLEATAAPTAGRERRFLGFPYAPWAHQALPNEDPDPRSPKMSENLTERGSLAPRGANHAALSFPFNSFSMRVLRQPILIGWRMGTHHARSSICIVFEHSSLAGPSYTYPNDDEIH